MRYWTAVCALTALLACAGGARAQVAPEAPHVYYNVQPSFVLVPGTSVFWWKDANGDYDVYRSGNDYYIMSNGYWYQSDDLRGQFQVVDDYAVPSQVSSAVTYRARYGDQWARRNDDMNNRNAPPAPVVSYNERIYFTTVPGTDVTMWRSRDGDFEVYRYGNTYYMTRNGWWYRAGDVHGRFQAMEERFVPQQVVMGVDYHNRYGDQDTRTYASAPTVVFRGRPDFVMVPGTSVYWWANNTGDYDLYRYGGRYYMRNGDTWYASPRIRGPFTVVARWGVPNGIMVAADYRSRNGDRWANERRRHHWYHSSYR